MRGMRAVVRWEFTGAHGVLPRTLVCQTCSTMTSWPSTFYLEVGLVACHPGPV